MPAKPTDPVHFYGFEHLLDRLRGMHLDDPDDGPERAWLEGLRDSEEITSFGRTLLSILHFRASRWEDTLLALAPLAEDEHYGAVATLLRAAALSRLGHHDEALATLGPSSGARTVKALLKAPPQNEHYGQGLLVACRANALWLAGQHELALSLAEAAANLPEASDYRWQELAQYASALQRWPLVLSAMSQVGEMDRRREAMVCLALAHAAQNEPEQAVTALKTAVAYDLPTRARVRQDPRLAALPGLAELLGPSTPDLSFIKRRKDIAHLLDSPALAAAGVRWVDAQTSKSSTTSACGAYRQKTYPRGLLWSVPWWKACAEIAKTKTYVAELPEIHRRSMGGQSGALFHDKKDPGHLWFTPNPALPPGLWVRLPATEAALLDAMAWFYPARRCRSTDLPRQVRAWAGDMRQNVVPNPYSGQLEAAGAHELGRFWVSSPVVDPLGWGSAYEEDPWPNTVRLGGGGGLTLSIKMREYGQDREDSLPRLNFRTTFSRSLLTMELHPGFVCVWDVRYRPSPFTKSIQRFNTLTGYTLPLDLPIDVAAAVFGFRFGTAEWIQSLIDDPESAGDLYPLITMWAAVGYGDLRSNTLLQRFLRHEDPNVAAAAINAIIRYNLSSLLAEAGTLPYPPDYLSVIAERLDQGIGKPQVQDEPYEDEDDDDEDDDDEEEDE